MDITTSQYGFSETTRQEEWDAQFSQKKDLFHIKSKTLGCVDFFAEKDVPAEELEPAAKICKTIMERFFDLLDNVTYMKHEHIQKEKEYGIPWRSAFKKELLKITSDIHCKLIGEENDELDQDPFMVMHKIVRQDAIDAATFDSRCQADLLFMLVDQLEFMEIGAYQIKKLLKTPDYNLFDGCKLEVRAALKKMHLYFNPDSENYKDDDDLEADAKKAERERRLAALKLKKISKGIRKSELKNIYKELFMIMDMDDDLVLNPEEFRLFMQSNYDLHGVKHDTSEIEASKIQQFYDMIDINHDGELQWEEVWNSLSEHYRGYFENDD